MRTSLNELKDIEGFLLDKDPIETRLLQEARICLDADFAEKVAIQKEAYSQVRQYARRQLREEIFSVEQQLFTAPKYTWFKNRVLQFFKT